MIRAETPPGFEAEYETLGDYLASWMWRNSRLRYRYSGLPRCCFICGSPEFELHHRTYAHCGREDPSELVPLCPDHHWMVERLVKGGWASRWDAHILLHSRLAARVDGVPCRLRRIEAAA